MENLMLFFIILGIGSTLLGLCSLVIPKVTGFFFKNPSSAKVSVFCFTLSIISSLIVAYLRSTL